MLLLGALMVTGTRAQTSAEWFRQQKTQKEYLLEQITALQLYHGYVKRGYAIAREGLTAIGDIKEGEFELHHEFFSSLERVNPQTRDGAKMAAIVAVQVKIVAVCQSTYRQLQESDALNRNEISYIYRVYGRLLEDGAAMLDELMIVMADDKLAMGDGERLKRIELLYSDILDTYTFAQSFSQEAIMLAAGRLQEKKNIQTSRAMYGIENQ